MNQIISPQDFSLDSCLIVSYTGQPIEIKLLVLELNYYEDIFTNCITGNMVITDSNQYLNKLNLNGNDVLILRFSKPGSQDKIEKIFRIYSISNREQTKDMNEVYVLNFCSEELYLSENILVSKSYRSKKVSDIVKDIAKNFLKVHPTRFKDSNIEETFGAKNLIVPNIEPLEAINWLCNYAIPSESQTIGAPFFFWENREGYNFKSLQSLYKQQPYSEYTYEMKNMQSQNDPRVKDLEKDFKSVIAYEHLKNFDSLDATMNGTFSNRLIAIDTLRRRFSYNDYDYWKYFNRQQKLNSMPLITNAKDRFGQTANTGYESVLKVCTTNTGHIKNKYIAKKSPDVKDNSPEVIVPHRTAQIAQLNTNRMRISIPGDPMIKTGDLIVFNLPELGFEFDRSKDLFYSGKYLVTALRHKMDQENKMITILEICKESLPNRYGLYNNESSQWKELRSR